MNIGLSQREVSTAPCDGSGAGWGSRPRLKGICIGGIAVSFLIFAVNILTGFTSVDPREIPPSEIAGF